MAENEYQIYKELNQQIVQKLKELKEIDERIETFEKANAYLDKTTDLRKMG
jgi:hypothetical protein